jgi:hypothetical protein
MHYHLPFRWPMSKRELLNIPMKAFRYLLCTVFALFLCVAATPTVRAGTFGLFTSPDKAAFYRLE